MSQAPSSSLNIRQHSETAESKDNIAKNPNKEVNQRLFRDNSDSIADFEMPDFEIARANQTIFHSKRVKTRERDDSYHETNGGSRFVDFSQFWRHK
jgi:hypothetical protein